MPDRIIRDELLASDTWLSLKRNTHRLAFLAAILHADSLGNLEASEAALWRLWRDPLALQDRASVAEILVALHDAGLVRLYEIGGKRYGHIPKFRQRLRYLKGRHPRPPSNIECEEIKELLEKSQTAGRPQTGNRQTAAVEEKRSEVKRSEEKQRARDPEPVDNSPTPTINTVSKKLKVNPEKPQTRSRDEQLAYVKANSGKP